MRASWGLIKTDPVQVIERLFGIKKLEDGGTLWSGARDIISSTFANRKTVINAGHAMSKDWSAGLLIIIWLLTNGKNAKVVVTAPTASQVKDIIFAEVEKQYLLLRQRFPEFRRDWLTTKGLKFGPACFAMGLTTQETNDTIGKFAGRHSENMLVIVSEAQAVPSDIFRQIRGLTTSPNSRVLELGNPLVSFGDFYEHCVNPALGYKVITLPVSMSPNITLGREVIPGMASQIWLDEFEQELIGQGIEPYDDSEYQSRVLAEFPQQSTSAWIPMSKIKACVSGYRRLKSAAIDKIRVGGLDTARKGNDETVHFVL